MAKSFIQQDAHKKKRLSQKWRKPRGLQSKMRLKKKGYSTSPSTGHRRQSSLRHTVRDVYPSHVGSLKDFEGLDQKKQGVIIRSQVGLQKKLILLKEAQKRNLLVLNVKDVAEFIKTVEEIQQQKTSAKTKSKVAKEEKKEKSKQEAAKKEKEQSLEKAVDTEKDEKQVAKKEKDKALIKREI